MHDQKNIKLQNFLFILFHFKCNKNNYKDIRYPVH